MPFDLLYYAGLAGIAVFAISGALAAAEKELDILGFILFATVTGIGGGTVRDLILGVEVAWGANYSTPKGTGMDGRHGAGTI